MQLILNPNNFVDNEYRCFYGDREALFTLVDEEFAGGNNLGRVNVITILVKDNNENIAHLGTSVIGMGDKFVETRTENPALRGKLLNSENISECVITLIEGE